MEKKEDKISIDTVRRVFLLLERLASKNLVEYPNEYYLFKDGKIRLVVGCACVDDCPFPLDIDVTIRKFESLKK